MRAFRTEIGAAALLILALAPFVTRLEFLADDYHMGREIARATAESPGLASALQNAFTRRWTDDFDVFRPLTILTLQWDWWLYGARPGLHHLTNLILWALVACVASHAVQSLRPDRSSALQRAGLTFLIGASPVMVECLGWCVAREDILCGLFGLTALVLQLRAPDRTFQRAACVAAAILAKETAVTLPLLLLWADLVLCRADVNGRVPSARERIARSVPAFIVLGVSLAVRHVLFGRVAGLYLGRPFTDWLTDAELPTRLWNGVGGSLLALLLPVSRSARAADSWLWLPAMLLALAILLGSLLALRSGSGRRRFLAFLPWILAPLTLAAVPLSGVSPDMEKSRLLLLPMCALFLAIAPTVLELECRATRMLVLILAAASFVALTANLQAWTRASETVRSLRREAMAIMGPKDVLILEGAVPLAVRGINGTMQPRVGLIPELIAQDGAYFLSQGIRDFTRLPFADGPEIILWTNDADASSLDATLNDRRVTLARLEWRDGTLTIVPRTPTSSETPGLAVEATHWNLTGAEPVLRVHVPDAGPWRLVLVAPEEPVRAEATFTSVAEKVFMLPIQQMEFVTPAGVRAPLSSAVLGQLGTRVLLAWVESADRSRRSLVTLISIAP